jgi:hypothetical protein
MAMKHLLLRCTFGPGWWHRDVALADIKELPYSSEHIFAQKLIEHAPHPVGSMIWVRETWAKIWNHDGPCGCDDDER